MKDPTRYHMAAADKTASAPELPAAAALNPLGGAQVNRAQVRLALSWIAVGIPIAWGIYETLEKAAVLLG